MNLLTRLAQFASHFALATVALTFTAGISAAQCPAVPSKLIASDGASDDYFGISIAVSGTTAIVGAFWDNDNGPLSGSAYLFDISTGLQIAKLLASDGATADRFGASVGISDTTVVVGAWLDDDNGSDSGSAYTFCVAKLFSDLCNGDGGDQAGCTACPCGNNAAQGTVGGCINSSGTALRLVVTGNPSVSLASGETSDLRFEANGAPAGAFCILNSGDGLAPGGMANPCFGMNSGTQAAAFDGLRCAIINTRRHGGRSADSGDDVGVTNSPWGGEGGPPAEIAVTGAGFVSGQTRYFQVIHQDASLLVRMRGLNTSQAIEVTFTPGRYITAHSERGPRTNRVRRRQRSSPLRRWRLLRRHRFERQLRCEVGLRLRGLR